MLIHLFKISRHAWHVSAAMLIIVALLAATARWLLLNIEDHRGWVEAWLSRTLDRPVQIGELRGHWRGWSPSIRIDELTIFEQDGSTALVRFANADVELSITASAKNYDLSPDRITVRGVKFTLLRDVGGNFSIAGMPPSRWPVAQWIEGQKQFDLTNADIEFIDAKQGNKVHAFNNLSLSIRRDGDMRHLTGRTSRGETSSEVWRFELSADESILESDWNGALRLNGDNIDTATLKDLPLPDADKASGRINLRIDSRWTEAKLRNANFAVELLETAGPTHHLTPLNSTESLHYAFAGSANRIDDGWAIGVEINRLGTHRYAGNHRPSIKLRWREPDGDYVWSINNIRIEDFSPYVAPYLNNGWVDQALFAKLAPHGVIAASSLLTSQDEPFLPRKGSVELHSLSWQEYQDIPGVIGVDAILTFDQSGARLNFTPDSTPKITSTKWLEQAVNVSSLIGTIDCRIDDNDAFFSSQGLTIKLESISLESSGTITLTAGNSPELNIFSQIKAGDLADIRKLVPKKLLPAKGERWARNAFKSGQIDGGAVVFRGAIADFPFDNQQGIFQAHIVASNADVQYGAKWPIANDVAGSLFVKNRAVEFIVTTGRIYSSDVSNSIISIDNLFTKQRYVQLSAKTQVDPTEVGRFIDQSPLINTKAKRYKELLIKNPFELELDLNLGIFPGGEKDVLGITRFKDNRIESRKLKLALDRVTGEVSFTRHDWYGEGLTADFRGNRVGVLLNGGLDDPNYDTQIRLTGTSDAEFLATQIKTYAPSLAAAINAGKKSLRLAGSTSWKAVISLPSTQEASAPAPKKLDIETSLNGLSIDMPWPLGKHREQTIPLSITVESQFQGDRHTWLRYGDRFRATLSESRGSDQATELRGADIVFGEEQKPPQTDINGIKLRGKLAQLQPQLWQQVLNDTLANAPKSTIARDLPVVVDLQVDELKFLSNKFNSLAIAAKKLDDGWLVQVDGADISGEINAPDDDELPVHLKFSRLFLPEHSSAEINKLTLDPKNIRPLKLESLTTRYKDIELGRVNLSVERINNGIKIADAIAEHGNFELRAEGSWILNQAQHRSQFDVSVHGNSLAGLLGGFGYDVVNIEGGATDLQVNARWQGTPLEFRLEELRGHLSLSVESGRFLDIEPGGGRLFGLLSLQTLPRRLSLDFNDLFTKGFSFDTIVGNFSIDQGNAYTNSLLMDGPSARIQISGRTGLKDQDYDQHVTVTPALSNSIPVASALFGPAGVGVGAVIYLGQKMFKSIPEQMDKFLSREYSITGDWSAPKIERI